MAELTSAMIKELKASAHTLSPIANVGKSGFTPTVYAEISKQLDKRELIKIKVLKAVLESESLSKQEISTQIESQLGCNVLAYTGNILILYRAHGAKD